LQAVPISIHTAVAASVGLLGLLVLGAGTPAGVVVPTPVGRSSAASAAVAALAISPCPSGTLPDVDVCVHVSNNGARAAESVVNAQRDVQDKRVVYDQIPRRPDRPAEYSAYRYPVACDACVVSGYDLDRPDERQRRGKRLRQVGHGAIDLSAPRAAPVTLVELEHQQGPADLVYVGPLFGMTVVTLHRVREANESRDYIVILGHLEAAAPGLTDRPGSPLLSDQLLGYVGDSGSPGLVHLHLEIRRVREGVDAKKLAPATLVDGANTVACDPRNLLPLK
jgi:murein DD-endopeptidase MepM/ murein hydrolase activator NlpD